MKPTLRHLILLIFCKEVTCAKLLSLNKNIKSSSTHNATNQNWDVRHAVDGNHTNTPDTCKCCAATEKESSPWYELDLGRKYLITKIDVEGRGGKDRYNHHLGRMKIFLAPQYEINSTLMLTIVNGSKYNFNFTLEKKMEARYITLERPKSEQYFVICELSVYGECMDGSYGYDCNQACGKCFNKEPCDKDNGTCNRCAVGYTGANCSSVCERGWYGYNCTEECGHCKDKAVCNFTDGSCPNGCDAGYINKTCKALCSYGRYGADCNETCGHCKNNKTCHHVNGTCLGKCESGYTGELCKTAQPNSSGVAYIGYILPAVLVSMVIAIIVTIIVTRKKRQRRPQIQKPKRQMPEIITNIDEQKENVDTVSNVEDIGDACFPLAADSGDHEYYAFVAKDTDIKIHQLWDFIVEGKRQNIKGFRQEFSQFPQGLHHPHDIALLEENRSKNRYRGLCAYDHTRVPLEAEEGESEYINACFINGYEESKKFIASQGPTGAMRDDFWRMIWQQKSNQVVMLTNLVEMGNEKCLIYWPTEGQVTYGKIKISLQSEEAFGEFVVRKLEVRKNRESPMIVTQYHFAAWPDKTVPDTTWSLIKFWRIVDEDRGTVKNNGPVVVHCSAGIGRTGTFIAIDNAYTQAKLEGVVRVQSVVRSLREQRVNMVQTLDQYVYVHEALAEAFLFGTHHTSQSQFDEVYSFLKDSEQATNQSRLQTQFDLLVGSIEDSYPGKEGVEGERRADKKQTTSLGAVFLPNWLGKDAFVILKTPKKDKLIEFWSLIQQCDVKTIVSLDDKLEADKERTCFHLDTNLMSVFNLTLLEETVNGSHMERTLTYKSKTREDRIMKQYECKELTSNNTEPIEPKDLINLIENVLHWQQELSDASPVLVHCPTGTEICGLVCVLLNELNRMKKRGGVLNILQSVKTMKARDFGVVSAYEQYLFLFEVIRCYLEDGEVYANVKENLSS